MIVNRLPTVPFVVTPAPFPTASGGHRIGDFSNSPTGCRDILPVPPRRAVNLSTSRVVLGWDGGRARVGWKSRYEGLEALVAERGDALLATAVLLAGSRAGGEDLLQ